MAYIRLFPLDIVVFPGEELHLHIFEDRYKQLIRECIQENHSFGILFYAEGKASVGTEMEIIRIEKTYPDGEMDVVVRGKRCFNVQEFFAMQAGKLYPAGQVDFPEENPSEDPTVHTKIADIFEQFVQLISPGKTIHMKENPYFSFRIGHHIGLNTEQEQELLHLSSESERQLFILRHFNIIMPLLYQMENLKERIRMNGHFKALTSPEL